MFGYLIPRNYMEAMLYDKENKNSKWHDAIKHTGLYTIQKVG